MHIIEITSLYIGSLKNNGTLIVLEKGIMLNDNYLA